MTESFLKIVNMSISADRVKSILTYRKPTFWVIVTALALFALVVVCLVTDPVQVTYTMGEAQPISKSDVQDEHVLCVWDVVHCSNIVTLSADFRHGEKYDWLKIQPMGLQLTDGEHVMKCKSMGITEEHGCCASGEPKMEKRFWHTKISILKASTTASSVMPTSPLRLLSTSPMNWLPHSRYWLSPGITVPATLYPRPI